MTLDANKTIIDHILLYLNQNQMNISSFAAQSGINSGTLSRYLQGQQAISVSNLDKITNAMGLKEGSLFPLYLNEFLVFSTPNWRRFSPFITRCAELGKFQLIADTVNLMMDHPTYLVNLFEHAERLYQDNYKEAALILYKSIAENEKNQHAERLGLCQYRIFQCSLNSDQEQNLVCCIQFEAFIERVPESVQLDALKDLADSFISLRKWSKAKQYATEMGRIARMRYANKHAKNRPNKIPPTYTTRPLFGYILYSDLLLSSIAANCEEYDEALVYLANYEDHSWIKETDSASEQVKKKFLDWALGNRYLYEFMSGNLNILEQYMVYITSRKGETLKALFKIMQFANRHQYDLDQYLIEFESLIEKHMKHGGMAGTYNKNIIDDQFCDFLADMGRYYLRKEHYSKGIKYIIDSLELSYSINNKAYVVKCTTILDHFRSKLNATDLLRFSEIQERYKNNFSML
ncbi:hypothetical protein JCM10914A_29070 [Paenibacillus sp. JCM 10914]|uniref:helix-turn-helix domain-containing protein n=1 Tax=Paenibacillus sp. JCM 10914 TaxID=1236974 RepID=UPI0003CC3361|nr:helix-turn-helix transcriptional regulator [Paenibacillus sp. JCM 10914]GAE08443.1 hypothetical protein JCM10914_4738 [Paenibacillus sp. JCM 10914]